jgi:hypothetical protein
MTSLLLEASAFDSDTKMRPSHNINTLAQSISGRGACRAVRCSVAVTVAGWRRASRTSLSYKLTNKESNDRYQKYVPGGERHGGNDRYNT